MDAITFVAYVSGQLNTWIVIWLGYRERVHILRACAGWDELCRSLHMRRVHHTLKHHSTPQAHVNSACTIALRTIGMIAGSMTSINVVAPSAIHAGAKAIAAGNYFSMVLAQDGSVWATGSNEYGQLGDGTGLDRLTFVYMSPGQCGTGLDDLCTRIVWLLTRHILLSHTL